MRIALCLEYPVGQLGGVEVLVSELIRGLGPRHQIILVSPDGSASLARSPVASFVSEHILISPVWNSVTHARSVAEKIAQARPDLAHFHFGNYGFGNRFPGHCPISHLHRRGIPCVTTAHLVVSIFDGYCGPEKPFWFKVLMFPLAWCGKMQQLRDVHQEIAVSQHDVKKLRAWYRPFHGRFMQLYHSRLQDEPAASENTKREPVILNVGHLAWRKGQLVLAEAFAQIATRHPEWILQLAGKDMDGLTRRQILQVAKDGKIENRIQLLEERNDALDLMRRAAIYVQPSYKEALGLALQEAMYCGCACIGSRAGGIPELIESGRTGLLFERGNVSQLAHALEQLIGSREQRENLGRAATASIRDRKMTSEGMVEQHLALYRAATGKT